MRLLDLRLIAYGPFTGVTLDLSGGAEGLHVVYGPNEAGKSSALRGLHDLLYGIPARTSDDFIHAMRDMRIGGCIRRLGGDELEFVRRKGNKETVLSTDDTALDDHVLDPFLAGVTSETFSRVFGIGHETLVEGGKELLAGGGDLGESLFAAGLGSTGFRQVLQGIDSEADKLFRSRGQKQTINDALSTFNAARRRVRETNLKERDWQDLRFQMEEAGRTVEELAESIKDLRRRRGALERVGRLIPLVGSLRECQSTLDELGNVKSLPESFQEDRRECEASLKASREAASEAMAEITRLEKNLKGMDLPVALLDVAEAVAQFKEDIGEYRKHGKDLPKRQAERARADEEAASILEGIRPDLDLDRIDEIRLSKGDVRTIRKLLKTYEGLLHYENAADKAIQEAEDEIEDARAELKELPVRRDAGELGRLIKRLRGLGDLDEALETAQDASTAGRQDCEVRARRLHGWEGTIDDLAVLPVPDPAVLDRFERDLADAGRDIDGIREDLKKCLEDRREADKNLAAMDNAGAVPLETDLESERRHRDQGWTHVRDAWGDGKAPTVIIEAYDPEQPLTDAFETSMKKADDVSDRLRREAERVNRRADLKAEVERLDGLRASLTEQRDGAEGRLKELNDEWKDLWSEIGITPLDPRSMRRWLNEYGEFVQAWDRLRESTLEAERLCTRIQEAREEIGSVLETLGEAEPGKKEGFQELIERAFETVEAIRKTEENRARLEDVQRKRKRALKRRKEEATKIAEKFKTWNTEWTGAMKKAGLDSRTPINEVEDQIERLERLFELVEESRKLQTRIAGMERDRKRFDDQVEGLLKRIEPDSIELPDGLDPVQKVQSLDRQVSRARTLEERKGNWTKELDRQNANLAKAKEKEAAAAKVQADLCKLAGCKDPGLLADLEKRSASALKLQDEIASLRLRIAGEAGDRSVEEAIPDAQGRDPDEVESEIHDIEAQIDELESRKTRAATDHGELKVRLQQLEEGVLATEAAEEAESALARARAGVMQYVPLRLAGAILRREVETYRKRHQGPLVTRAGEVFGRLTLGAFKGLAPDWEDDDRPVLIGIRADDERVRVEHLSDGTRDQLYLALRLASLEMHVGQNEPMPFVVDDVLINFDDDRARAGLEVLGELSKKTQVILFTHHKRIVELAKEAVLKKTLFTREIGI